MSHNTSSPSPSPFPVNDPRQPATARRYVEPPDVAAQDIPIDYSGLLAMIFAVAGFMFKYKLLCWIGIICCAQSFVNMKNFATDLKQVSMALMFAIMGLLNMYLGIGKQNR